MLARASRRSGLKSVRPELLTTRSSSARELRPRLRGHPQSRLAHVAFDDFDALGDEIREPVAKLLLQRVEYGRLLENFLKAPLRGRRALAADQQVNLADLRDFVQKLRQPHLADKARYPDQQNVFPRQGAPDGERFGLLFPVEYDQGAMVRRLRALGRQNCLLQRLRMGCEAQISQQAVRRHAAIGAALEGPSDWGSAAESRDRAGGRWRFHRGIRAGSKPGEKRRDIAPGAASHGPGPG